MAKQHKTFPLILGENVMEKLSKCSNIVNPPSPTNTKTASNRVAVFCGRNSRGGSLIHSKWIHFQ